METKNADLMTLMFSQELFKYYQKLQDIVENIVKNGEKSYIENGRRRERDKEFLWDAIYKLDFGSKLISVRANEAKNDGSHCFEITIFDKNGKRRDKGLFWDYKSDTYVELFISCSALKTKQNVFGNLECCDIILRDVYKWEYKQNYGYSGKPFDGAIQFECAPHKKPRKSVYKHVKNGDEYLKFDEVVDECGFGCNDRLNSVIENEYPVLTKAPMTKE